MVCKRIIPCLDIKDGRCVKGTNFVDLKDAGDPIALAKFYSDHGADELVFLDITATEQGRDTLYDLVYEVAMVIDIPFTVGGGISNPKVVEELLKRGADKISVNSSAFKNPSLITELSENFGAQCIVVAIDAKLIDEQWMVHLVGGKQATQTTLYNWALKAQNLGAGELLFTSMNNDGTKNGFANDALLHLNSILNIPVIASGGAGSMTHFVEAFTKGKADAALAASVFHFNEIDIAQLKNFLLENNINIRPIYND